MKKKGLAPTGVGGPPVDEFFGSLDPVKIFVTEFEQFEEADKNIQDLTTQFMTQFEDVAKNKGRYRDALKFMADMGKNIVSLHDSRRQLIKERFNVKKAVLDQLIKKQKADEEEGGDDSAKFMDAVFKVMKDSKFAKNPSEKIIDAVERVESDVERLIHDIGEVIENADESDAEYSDGFTEPEVDVNYVVNFLQELADNDFQLALDENYTPYFINSETFEEIENDAIQPILDKFQFKEIIYPQITFNIESDKFEIVDTEGDIYEIELIESE